MTFVAHQADLSKRSLEIVPVITLFALVRQV
jgi:hypothetical protein